MLENTLLSITKKLRLHFYKHIFSVIREGKGSLSAMEVFSVEVIHHLNKPTVSEFADFLGISRPAASYKVASLIRKGYVVKEPSEDDRREFLLRLTDKYFNSILLHEDNFRRLVAENEKKHSEETLCRFHEVLDKIDREL